MMVVISLGLAVPLVVAILTSVSAQKGLLIRNRTAFENATVTMRSNENTKMNIPATATPPA